MASTEADVIEGRPKAAASDVSPEEAIEDGQTVNSPRKRENGERLLTNDNTRTTCCSLQ